MVDMPISHSLSDEEEKLEEFYEVELECTNCGASGEMEIKRGVRVLDFAEGNECPICGCMMFDIEDLDFR